MRATVFPAILVSAVSSALAQPVLPTWKLDASPLLTIEGEGHSEFTRIASVFRLTSGHVAVLNGATAELRIFDSQGAYVSTFGRQGSGPGEFQWPRAAWRAGDTLAISDGGLLRLTTILAGPVSKLERTTSLATQRSERSAFDVRGRTRDGKLVMLTSPFMRWEGVKGVERLNASLGLLAGNGTGSISWVAEIPAAYYFVCNPTGDFKKGGIVGLAAFTPFPHAAATGSHVWYGDGGSDSLVAISGSSRSVIRLPIPARKPSASSIQSLKERFRSVSASPNSKHCLELSLSAEFLPKLLPYYETIIPGAYDELWVQEYAGNNSAPTRYLVIGADLKPRAWVPVPAGFRAKDVGRDYVAGVHFDEDELETVRVYRLSR